MADSHYTKLNDEKNKYSALLDTGDVLLFRANDDCTSCCNCLMSALTCCIRQCTASPYNHAAMVIRDPMFFGQNLKGLFVLQSTGYEDYQSVETKENNVFGVQLNKLEQVIDGYDGQIWVRHLHFARTDKVRENLRYAHAVVHNIRYDSDPIDWIDALFNVGMADRQKKTTMFCSALVAFLLTAMELLPYRTPWSVIRPVDLSTSRHSRDITFINCEVDDEVQIKY